MQEVQWFILGVLCTLTVFGFAFVSIRVSAPWYAWVVLIGGAVAVLFGTPCTRGCRRRARWG